MREEFAGRIRYEHHDFPLRQVTFRAAEAVHCAADQGKGEEMSAMVYSGQEHWYSSPQPEEVWLSYAAAVGADTGKWRACMSSGKHRAAIEADRKLGLKMGVDATPTIFVGNRKIVGVESYQHLASIVQAALGR